MKDKSVLVVDDEESILKLVSFNLQGQGYQVDTAPSGEEGIRKFNKSEPDLVITDIMMEGISGLEVLKEIKRVKPDTMVIMLTGYGSLDSAVEALRLGAYDYLQKPYSRDELAMKVDKCLRKQEMERQVHKLTESLIDANSKLTEEIEKKAKKEEKLKELAAELQRSNRDLQEFSTVVSHDLQEPLRKVMMFADRIREKCGDEVDDKTKEYFSVLETSVRRMQDFISDLLDYSKVGHQGKSFKSINLNQVVADVLDDLEVSISETGGQVNIENLPALDADPLQMRQLFQNLIGNALKFHRPGEPPEITIKGSKDGEGNWVIRVEDNGIGFDIKSLEKIFEPFQRLHGRSAYEGTGMGLAICAKIVSRHGGTLSAESQKNEGAAFIVKLPEKQD